MNNSIPLINSITGLRFFAAITIVVAHGTSMLLVFYNNPSLTVLNWLTRVAGIGMPLFFVLSGFVIHYNYSNKVTTQGLSGRLEFIWARFSRLYPLFFLVLIVDLLTNGDFADKMMVSPNEALDTLQALPSFLILIHSWFFEVIAEKSLIYQIGLSAPLTWSISTEWFFYLAYLFLVYPLVLLCRNLSRLKIILVICIWIVLFWFVSSYITAQTNVIDSWAFEKFGSIATIKNGYQDSFIRWLIYFSPYARIGEFITGCLISALYLSVKDKAISRREAQIGSLLTWVALLLVPLCLFLIYSEVPIWQSIRQVGNNIGMAPCLALLIFCSARYESTISKILCWRPIVAMGEASYSIYLLHLLIFAWIAGTTHGNLLNLTPGGIAFGTARFLLVLLIIITFSLGSYNMVEVPARRWLRKQWKKNARIQWRVIGILMLPVCAAGILLQVLNVTKAAVVSESEIIINYATYGGNCGAATGNATADVQAKCSTGNICHYTIDVKNLGDPAPGCGKDFRVEYSCKKGVSKPPIIVPGGSSDAGLGTQITLDCSNTPANNPYGRTTPEVVKEAEESKQMLNSSPPQLIEENYKGFYIATYGAKFYILSHLVPFEPGTNLASLLQGSSWEDCQAKKLCTNTNSLEEAKQWVDLGTDQTGQKEKTP